MPVASRQACRPGSGTVSVGTERLVASAGLLWVVFLFVLTSADYLRKVASTSSMMAAVARLGAVL